MAEVDPMLLLAVRAIHRLGRTATKMEEAGGAPGGRSQPTWDNTQRQDQHKNTGHKTQRKTEPTTSWGET